MKFDNHGQISIKDMGTTPKKYKLGAPHNVFCQDTAHRWFNDFILNNSNYSENIITSSSGPFTWIAEIKIMQQNTLKNQSNPGISLVWTACPVWLMCVSFLCLLFILKGISIFFQDMYIIFIVLQVVKSKNQWVYIKILFHIEINFINNDLDSKH